MHFLNHPETTHFDLGSTFKGGLFAMPVLLHPQLLTPGVDPLADLNYEAVGQVLHSTGVLSHKRQDVTFLARAVDARFISSARGDMQKSVLKTLVAMHRSLPAYQDGMELFRLGGFDPSGGGLVFLIGAVYRQVIDPLPVCLPDPGEFLISRARFEIEVALGGGGCSFYRHQVLAPFTLSKAIGEGVTSAVRCWSGMYEEPLSCNFDLTPVGDVTMQLSDGEDLAVSLRFGHDAMTADDLALIQSQVIRSAGTGTSGPRYLLH
jgi:hypothetical protein